MTRWARLLCLMYALAALAAPGAHDHDGPEFAVGDTASHDAGCLAPGPHATEHSSHPLHPHGGDCLACQVLAQKAVTPGAPPAPVDPGRPHLSAPDPGRAARSANRRPQTRAPPVA